MADKNQNAGNRRAPLLQWVASTAIVLVIFGIVGAHVRSRSPASQSPTDVSSRSRALR